MKKPGSPGFSARLMLITAGLLLAANLILGTLLVNSSRSAMKALIQNRMLDISSSAADMLDGDTLESLRKEDKGTPAYQKINDTLAVFQENIDLKYIYCISEVGDGQFVFSVDPTIEDPGEFGSPIVYTDALYRASKGKPSVDDEAYSDEWGRFYSAYSPVFDSKGKVAGIVAVDFSADWYDEQIMAQTRVIIICSILGVVVSIVMIFVATARMRRELKSITRDIIDVTNEVDELNHEIAPEAVKENVASSDDIRDLSASVHRAKEGLRLYTATLHSQTNNMIAAISPEYRAICYVDLDHNNGICLKAHTEIDDGVRQGENYPYFEKSSWYAEKYIAEEYRDAFMKTIDPQEIKNTLDDEHIITYRYMVERNGQESYEMIRIAKVIDHENGATPDDGAVHAIAIGFSDVDEETRRSMERAQALREALAAAQVANKAKTAFLSNMSHEIRTPMNAIIGLDRIALSDNTISDSTRGYLEKIGSSADHLLKIINDILDMSRIEAGRMTIHNEVFSLDSLLDQINVMIGGQCAEKGLFWEWKLVAPPGKSYLGDDMKLKQVLINILGNSVKFTKEGGVYFTVERVAEYDGKSVFRFTMRDTGIGMTEDFIPKLFEPFAQEDVSSRSKYGSTGLGMPITKSIIEMMNGEIKVDSKKNVGTTFTVTLTFTDSGQSTENSDEINLHEMNVLIVDDNPVDCEFARIELEKAGVNSEIALSGAQAVEMVQLKHARRESYHMILVDWKMPDMDGLETAKRIRRIIGKGSTIVMLTAYKLDEVIDEAKDVGVDSLISKPLEAENILSRYKQSFAIKADNDKAKISLKGKRILLAEDVDINAEIMLMLLQMRELQVDRAENGAVAVEMFSTHPVGYYDAILMDMRMPVMDGLQATKMIREMKRIDAQTMPIIALTANAFDEDVQRSLQAGLNAHLSKPVEPESLFETLESLIDP